MLARVIPEQEAWLHENSETKEAVLAGIEQARTGQFAKAPDIEGDGPWADSMPGD